MPSFKAIGLIGRLGSTNTLVTLKRLIRFLQTRGCRVIVEDHIAESLLGQAPEVMSSEAMGQSCDLVIVVGGDGSLLGAARVLCSSGTPVLGVNRGRLGFLTDIAPDEVEEGVGRVLDGEFEHEARFLLDMRVQRNGECIARGNCLNDVVLHPGKAIQMLEFELFINEQFVYTLRADGLIIATPTGSTAYALSGGGPILHPGLDAIELVPLSPHTLSSRPIVVDADSRITLHVGETNEAFPHLSCDGQSQVVAQPGDIIEVKRLPERLNLIHPVGHDFYAICRNKLGWSSRLGE
ncbi:NAD(+) kinase [Larsenimonas suaedae]|uniref:NAD kinase n=1 Tax=Larsenimonas suaedae TaxID=1851019 RepID=A0ABU1GY35_9GAMM|nr:NAD(+) kinase [Larsenimonas suaedae]MCM2971514.1 NAD(+) kinase [Larsenimonas suaedae]MDR5896770.1 NAD(+) kinase [Larsenimonas suaedae]